MSEDWRSLRVGDRIRIVRLPSGVDKPGYVFHPDTRELYECLIRRGRPLTVAEIDEYGGPWIHCQTKSPKGTWIYHSLCVSDDSWVRVKPYRPRKSGPPT